MEGLIHDEYTKRKDYIKSNDLEAYRLITATWDLPVAVDIYKDNAVIHLFEKVSPETLQELEGALRKIIGVGDIFYKDRTKEKTFEKKNGQQKEIIVKEYGHTFSINLSDYLDTGLFLDHRETRRWIEGQSKGKIVLNTFAYTGSFSIYAAAGGAEKTYSVDLSKTYCEWIKKNLELNNLPPEKNWVYKMDTREFFRYASRKKLDFDIIIIDPPTFSRNKGDTFMVQKDHPALINDALKLLRPDGFIVFSTNYKDFYLDEAKLSACKVEERSDMIPPDFQGWPAPHLCYIISEAARELDD